MSEPPLKIADLMLPDEHAYVERDVQKWADMTHTVSGAKIYTVRMIWFDIATVSTGSADCVWANCD